MVFIDIKAHIRVFKTALTEDNTVIIIKFQLHRISLMCFKESTTDVSQVPTLHTTKGLCHVMRDQIKLHISRKTLCGMK